MRRSVGEVIIVIDNLGVEGGGGDAAGVVGDHPQGNALQLVHLLDLHSVLRVGEKYLDGGVRIIRVVRKLFRNPHIGRDASDCSLASKHELVGVHFQELVCQL